MAADDHLSRYLAHLPAAVQATPLLGRFLLAFERILTGLDAPDAQGAPPVPPGIEQILDRIHTWFDPLGDPALGGDAPRAPDDFLPWLAGWVATSLRDDWDSQTRRRFISNIASLYRMRGTRATLKTMLELYTDVPVEIDESSDVPHYFRVSFTVKERDPAVLARKDRIARAIIDQEKPAHTFYGLLIKYPTMQIINNPDPAKGEEGLIIGKNTVLGSASFKG